ncbi:MAG TPA: EfeM/EfeO family lipoprotein [Solirubrobacteraceae bacterium]|nr:EfeM/EfeO family lipoprotein [Solirubrobacteraceae bacterium]
MSRPPISPRIHVPRRARRVAGALAAVLLLVLVVLVAAAVLPGSHSQGALTGTAARDVARSGKTATGPARETKVVGSRLSARKYASVAAAIENGVTGRGQYVSDLTPISWRRFLGPIARYKRYAESWAVRLGDSLHPLTSALRAGDRGTAERDWVVSFDDYLHLGAVYGFIPARLDDAIAEVPPSQGQAKFPGLHMIEKGLWTGRSPRSLVPAAAAISRAVVTLRHTIPGMWVGAFNYILRAHEIMEDAQRDLLSGAEVPWSREGVSATAAALVADRKVIQTLTPLLDGRDNTLGVVQYWEVRMAAVLRKLRRRDGSYPTLGQLSTAQHELLAGTLAGTCTALSAVPDTLELRPIPQIPRDPARR